VFRRSPVLKIAFLVSGNGSLFEHIARKCQSGEIKAEVVRLISSSSQAFALQRASTLGIQTSVIDPKAYPTVEVFEQALSVELDQCGCNLICLAGYLKKIPSSVVKKFAGRMINIHPALLPAFGGSGMYGMKVHQAVIDYGTKISGATVHFVDDEYDHGPIIAQRAVYVHTQDNAKQLAERVHAAEFELYSRVVGYFADYRIRLQGRHVTILPPQQS